jgi:transposase-like protein
MGTKTRKQYTPQEREEIIRYVSEHGPSFSELRELLRARGVPLGTFRCWWAAWIASGQTGPRARGRLPAELRQVIREELSRFFDRHITAHHG